MATKSYSKHKEYKEYSSSGNAAPYTDEQFDMLKTELIPRHSKLNTIDCGAGAGAGTREYHYEYKEEKHPTGKYDRKDLHTVEEYTVPAKTTPKGGESSSYYYTREERELPALTGTRTYNYESTSSTPGYSKVKTSKTKELSQNVEELDSLLDDLQKDQERQLYKSGYASDTAESTSFDYKRGTTQPIKAPSSGYSTLKREERVESSSWGSSPPPPVQRTAELRQELYREEKTESRVVPAPAVSPLPPVGCSHCHHATSTIGTLSRSSTPMNKVTTTVKTYTYEVPADQDPTTVPLPSHADHEHTYLSTSENLRSSSTTKPSGSPAPGCQYCSHCNSRVREYRHVTSSDDKHLTAISPVEHTNERMVYPAPANEVKLVPSEPRNGHGPYSPTSYKYSETSYSAHNTTERYPPGGPPTGTTAPFPRPTTPSVGTQQPPKRLDDLLADFPEARYPTQPDGVIRRKVEVSHHASENSHAAVKAPPPPSRNAAGPAVYYPPGHTPFQKKEEGYQASAMQAGGAHASGRGMYEYESGAKSKEKHSEKKTAVPICLPLCCAMPCVIM